MGRNETLSTVHFVCESHLGVLSISSIIFKVHSSEFYFHNPITVHIELYFCYHFIHFLQSVGQY